MEKDILSYKDGKISNRVPPFYFGTGPTPHLIGVARSDPEVAGKCPE